MSDRTAPTASRAVRVTYYSWEASVRVRLRVERGLAAVLRAFDPAAAPPEAGASADFRVERASPAGLAAFAARGRRRDGRSEGAGASSASTTCVTSRSCRTAPSTTSDSLADLVRRSPPALERISDVDRFGDVADVVQRLGVLRMGAASPATGVSVPGKIRIPP